MKKLVVLLVSLTAALASAQEEDPPPGQDPAQKRAAVQQLLKVIKGEPSIKEVQRWALRHYKLEPGRINAMASASHWKGLIPEIEASLDNSLGHTFSNTRDGLYPILPSPVENPNPEYYKERIIGSNDQLTWRGRAVWSLDRLAFNAESLDVKSLTSIQENLVREVTTLFYARRRLLASLFLSPPGDDEELFYELTRLDEMTSTLDALTGGQFEKRSWKWDEGEKEAGKGAAKVDK